MMKLAALVLIAAVIGTGALMCDRKARKRLFACARWVFTYASGAPLDGSHHTDATFFRHPTKVKHPRGRLIPHKWHWRPGWHRALIRTAGPLTALGAAAGLLLAAEATLISLAVVAALAVTWAGWRGYRKVRRWWWPSTSS